MPWLHSQPSSVPGEGRRRGTTRHPSCTLTAVSLSGNLRTTIGQRRDWDAGTRADSQQRPRAVQVPAEEVENDGRLDPVHRDPLRL